ncbi:MAG TPA: hypothetical protein VGN27_14610 [Gaiellaceae bacterium]|jgi:hypothetical protein|nr:hypothetical protein [Gaiellaceae bacterium]
MKRTFVLAATAVAALSAAAVAVGHGLDSAKSVKEVSGTFAATTVARTSSHTCTTADGKTIVTTDGMYTGTASGDPTLTGNATIRAHSTVNTTDGIGIVSGTLRIDGGSAGDTETRFDAVIKGTSLAGLASGRVHDPSAKLLANLSSDFGATTGFANGKLGGTSGGTAVEAGPGSCVHSSTDRETSHANGTVSASSATSITVAGLTCSVPVSLQSLVAPLTVGTRAEISCSLSGGVNTLVKATARHR